MTINSEAVLPMNKTNFIFGMITRILTMPPIVTGGTVFLLYYYSHIMTWHEMLMSELFFLILPALAYPVSLFIPGKMDMRTKQRSTALVFSLIGYALGFIWTLLSPHSEIINILFGSYIISVIALIICTKLLKFRASGHACSTTAPAVLLPWHFGLIAVIPCTLLILAVYNSSLKLKRHSLAQLFAGSAISIGASIICIICSLQ